MRKAGSTRKPERLPEIGQWSIYGDFIVLHLVNADDNSTPPSSSTQGSLRAGGAIRRKKQIPRVLPLRAGMAKLLREAKKPVLSSWGRAKTADRSVSAPHDHGLMSSLESGLKPNKKALFRGRSLIIARGVLGREISYAAFACATRR